MRCQKPANAEVKKVEKLEIFAIIEINEFIDNSDNLDNLDDVANNSQDATGLPRFADFEGGDDIGQQRVVACEAEAHAGKAGDHGCIIAAVLGFR